MNTIRLDHFKTLQRNQQNVNLRHIIYSGFCFHDVYIFVTNKIIFLSSVMKRNIFSPALLKKQSRNEIKLTYIDNYRIFSCLDLDS